MQIILSLFGTNKKITLIDDRAESSYGIPVAVFDGIAYGPADLIPFGPSEMAWLKDPAATTVAAACTDNKISGDELEFARRFFA